MVAAFGRIPPPPAATTTTTRAPPRQLELTKLATQEQLTHGQGFLAHFKDSALPVVSPPAAGLPSVALTTDLQPRNAPRGKRAPQATILDEPFDPYEGAYP